MILWLMNLDFAGGAAFPILIGHSNLTGIRADATGIIGKKIQSTLIGIRSTNDLVGKKLTPGIEGKKQGPPN